MLEHITVNLPKNIDWKPINKTTFKIYTLLHSSSTFYFSQKLFASKLVKILHRQEGLPMLNLPESLVFDEEHNKLYIAEFGNNWVSEYSFYDKKLTVLAGGAFGSRDHQGTDATFYHPTDVSTNCSRFY